MKRNKFSLSNYKLTTHDMGYLFPIGCYEVLPGDTIQHGTSALIRCTPLATPPMHPVSISIHHWFVPLRIIWDEFEDFITGGDYGSTPPVHPFAVSAGGWNAGTIADHFGLPIGVPNLTYSTLPFRAYHMIFNEHYRDQDLTSEVALSKASGVDATLYELQESNWGKDYFTQARPWPQKSPDITIPMNTGAGSISAEGNFRLKSASTSPTPVRTNAAAPYELLELTTPPGAPNAALQYAGGVQLAPGASGTIAQLREAFALQRYAEARAQYGSRYTEYLRFLGVRSSDARLQRPEYLGGGKSTMQFSEVLQTGPTSDDGTQTVGEMFGHGMGSMRSNRFRRFFEEHGLVLSLMQTMPKPMYSQGMSKMWNRQDKEDYYQRELEHIGQQEIKKREIFVDSADPAGDSTWGWTDRYQEYKYQPNTVANGFRPGSLYDDWHFSRAFTTAPVLNDGFLRGPVTKRPFADQSNNTLLVMARHSIQARRMMSKKPTPHVY